MFTVVLIKDNTRTNIKHSYFLNRKNKRPYHGEGKADSAPK